MLNLTIKQILRLAQVDQPRVIDPWKSAVGTTIIFNPGYFSNPGLALQSVNSVNDILIDLHSDRPISEFTKSRHSFDVLHCILANLHTEKNRNPALFDALFYPLAKVYLMGFEEDNKEWATGWIEAHLSLDPKNTRLSGLFSAMKAVKQNAPYVLHMIDSYERIEAIPEVTDFDAAIETAYQQQLEREIASNKVALSTPRRTKHHNSIFSSYEKNAYISANEMAKSAFGQKRPDGHDDPWRDCNPSMRKQA